jgi:RNA polymerase sigma factor (TIGR02999 family)
MKIPAPNQITQILTAINEGDHQAMDRLFPLVYDQLRRMAKSRMAQERSGEVLQTTAIVHEVYLRLLGDEQPHWESRRHFFSVAAEAMRRILIENARQRASLKRGGNWHRLVLTENIAGAQGDPELLLILDQALGRLHVKDPQMSEVVKLRCFAGLTVKETAMALKMSPRNVDRHWAAAKAWLYHEMGQTRKESGKSLPPDPGSA